MSIRGYVGVYSFRLLQHITFNDDVSYITNFPNKLAPKQMPQ